MATATDPRLASMSPDELKTAMRTLGYRTQGDLAGACKANEEIVTLARSIEHPSTPVFIQNLALLLLQTEERCAVVADGEVDRDGR